MRVWIFEKIEKFFDFAGNYSAKSAKIVKNRKTEKMPPKKS